MRRSALSDSCLTSHTEPCRDLNRISATRVSSFRADELHGFVPQVQPVVLAPRSEADPLLHWATLAGVVRTAASGVDQLGDPLRRPLDDQASVADHGEDPAVD